MRGRKPLPTERKKLRGNPGKRPLNINEPDFDQVVDIDPPEWLEGIAKECWEMLAPQLVAAKVVKGTDLHNLEAFCENYALWRQATEEYKLEGLTVSTPNGGLKKNPAITVANEALSQVKAFGALLGLDPSSRSRIMVAKPETPKPEKKSFSSLLPK
ncbi:phage terminase small subunit P27 family [Spartinivicinus poritis]|uniref:Phage terminase small subunit P27 family n=1 Tax=Spartinivicinus poritis TaxID=2994640 RepID=A0ABT5UJQ5_9GAMM|nr:phage terminase small subunit P27 family [Spartinivicinus sp. A2-2]MDE1465643.1 phage terminase small subunit P27 family [Spartinivicinus sp. A2-2]